MVTHERMPDQVRHDVIADPNPQLNTETVGAASCRPFPLRGRAKSKQAQSRSLSRVAVVERSRNDRAGRFGVWLECAKT